MKDRKSDWAYIWHGRMNQTMERLKKMEPGEYSTLVRVLFGLESPAPVSPDLHDSESGSGLVEFIDQTLNDSQKEAVRFALASQEVALIHGPPGVSEAQLSGSREPSDIS